MNPEKCGENCESAFEKKKGNKKWQEPWKAKYWIGSPYEPEFVKVKFDGSVRWDHMARVVTFCEMDIDELRDINNHIIFRI